MFKSRYNFLILTLFIATLAGSIYAIESLAPHCCDDIPYSLRIIEDASGKPSFSLEPNNSIADTIESVRNLRRIHNSRLGNVLYVILHSIGHQPLVCLVNTIGIVGFIICLSLYGCRKISVMGIAAAAAASGFLLPVAEKALIWQDAAMNYGLGSLLLCLFLQGLRRTLMHPESMPNTLFTAAIALLSGLHHEGMGLPLLTALVAFSFMGIIRCKRYPYSQLFIYALLLATGLIFLIASPGVQARISSAQSSHKATLLECAALFIYRCCLMLPVFLICLWKGRKSWLDSYTLYCIPPAVVVAVFGSMASKWGGSCFFAAFFMLAYVAENMGSRINTLGIKTLATTMLVTCCGLICSFIHMSGLRHMYDNVMKQHPRDGVYCLNYFQEDYTYNWWIRFSLPINSEPHHNDGETQGVSTSDMICRLYGRRPLKVVVNQLITSPAIYRMFDREPADNAISKQVCNLCIIRLPRLCEPMEFSNKGYAMNKAGKKYPLYSHLSQYSEFKTLRNLLGKPGILVSPAYENGFYYVALDVPFCDVVHIELPVYNAATQQDEMLTVTTVAEE